MQASCRGSRSGIFQAALLFYLLAHNTGGAAVLLVYARRLGAGGGALGQGVARRHEAGALFAALLELASEHVEPELHGRPAPCRSGALCELSFAVFF